MVGRAAWVTFAAAGFRDVAAATAAARAAVAAEAASADEPAYAVAVVDLPLVAEPMIGADVGLVPVLENSIAFLAVANPPSIDVALTGAWKP
uniref:Putative secreted peptide n=1 Tax=Anopheles braziliensis TaxID=58242 RepID=A0A2M3ZNZ1_9DIPT